MSHSFAPYARKSKGKDALDYCIKCGVKFAGKTKRAKVATVAFGSLVLHMCIECRAKSQLQLPGIESGGGSGEGGTKDVSSRDEKKDGGK